MKSLARAFVIFILMALLTVHFTTGLFASFTEKVPRAVEGIDTVIQVGLVSWLGRANTLSLLILLTLALPVLAYFGGARSRPQVHPTPAAVIQPSRMQRAVDRAPAPKSDLSPQDRQVLANLLEGVAAQVAHEREMVNANERPKPFVRLIPQVPILPGAPPRSWFGGNPSLPAGSEWPTCEGRPATFLAQIDCSGLPPELWDGVGPRTGWLSFFLGYEGGFLAAKILHTSVLGTPLKPPSPIEFEWLYQSEIPTMHWTALARRDIPRWPVDVVAVLSREEDPLVRPVFGRENDGDPRSIRYRNGFDLNAPCWTPFDRATTLLMLDTAIAHARQTVDYLQKHLTTTNNALERLAVDPGHQTDGDAARQRAQGQSAEDIRSIEAWQVCLLQVKALRAEFLAKAASRPFSQSQPDELIAALSAMIVPGRNGRPAAQAFPTLCPPESPATWLSNWATLAQQHARHLYSASPRALPTSWRAGIEEQAAFDAPREMGTMRHVPDGNVHLFEIGSEVTLLQLPTSHLMNWMWGDCNELVLTIGKVALERADYGQVTVQITN